MEKLQKEIDHLLTENIELKKELEQSERSHKAAHRDLFFMHAIGGGFFPSVEDLIKDAENCDIHISHPGFAVITSRIETWGPLFTDIKNVDYRDMFFIQRNVLTDVFSDHILVSVAEF